MVGMGAKVYESSPAARAIYDRADATLGFQLSKLCFEGPLETLTLTENTQPALVATSIAILAALREQHPQLPAPAFAAGHSLGEYSALVAAGAFSLEDAVRVAHLRGKAMQRAVKQGEGGMAAIMGGSREQVELLCRDAAKGQVLTAVNFNAPGQIVVAGHAEAVTRAIQLSAERKLKAISLKVSAPFHCPLMGPAADAMRSVLSDVKVSPLAFSVVANVDATANDAPERVAELLVRQIDAPVLWQQTIEMVVEAGVDRAIEIGPGKVLAGLVKRIRKNLRVMSVSDPDSIAETAAFLAG